MNRPSDFSTPAKPDVPMMPTAVPGVRKTTSPLPFGVLDARPTDLSAIADLYAHNSPGASDETDPVPVGFRFGTGPGGGARYEVVGPLGHGGTGRVYKVRDLSDGSLVALKVAELGGADVYRVAFERELKSLRAVHSDRVVRKFDHYYVDLPGVGLSCIYLMELYRFDLRASGMLSPLFPYAVSKDPSAYEEKGHPTALGVLRIMADIAKGVADIHEAGIAHGDIKPENVFLDEKCRAYVGDLGLSTHHAAERTAAGEDGFVLGTPGYDSPELIKDRGIAGQGDDIYALGCVLYEVMCRVFPTRIHPNSSAATHQETLDMAGCIGFPEGFENPFGPEVANLVLRMLKAAKIRPTAADVAEALRDALADMKKEKTSVDYSTNKAGMLPKMEDATISIPSKDVPRLIEENILRPGKNGLEFVRGKGPFTKLGQMIDSVPRRIRGILRGD